MSFDISPTNIPQSFEEIAGELINKHHLEVNGYSIKLCDLEFYWNDGGDHADASTHEHGYESGQLRPHGSGYDLALKNSNGYGGILIRGVLKDDVPTYGPIRCADVIFKAGESLLKGGFHVQLIEKKVPSDYLLFPTVRIGLKEEGKFWNQNYRFICCRADYLCEVEGKTKLCEAIGESEVKVEDAVLKAALVTPRRKVAKPSLKE